MTILPFYQGGPRCARCAYYRWDPAQKGHCERIRKALKRIDRGTAARAADFQVRRTDHCSKFLPVAADSGGVALGA